MPLSTSIILLDKPLGLSSNAALQRVRWLLGKPKAGHTGTLDPLATGMLPICLGEATKFAGYLLTESKCYQTRIVFGIETASGDRDGLTVAEAPLPQLSAAIIEDVLPAFVGEISQTPPMYSAIKHEGLALYKRARAGETVAVKSRQVRVDAITVNDFGADFIDLNVECGTGTYIRTLGMDIARALGSVGHLASLRRPWVSPFQQRPMATMQDLIDWCEGGRVGRPQWLMEAEDALVGLPLLNLDADACLAMKQGRSSPQIGKNAGEYRLRDGDGRFFGLGQIDETGILRAKRLLATGR